MPIKSTAAETLSRIEQKLASLTNPLHKKMLAAFQQHWRGEVTGDLDSAMAVLPENSYFELAGALMSGEPFTINSALEHRAVYQMMLDHGLNPGGAFSDERFAFSDWGLIMEAVYSNVVYGAMLSNIGEYPAEKKYLFHAPMVMICYFDDAGNMTGKRDFMALPTTIEEADDNTLSQLLAI